MAALLLALGGCAPGDPGFGAIFAEDVSYYGAPQAAAYPAPIVTQAGWGETTIHTGDGQVSPEPMGWGSKTFVMPAPPMAGLMAMPGPNSPYILGTGDKLRVFVYGQPSLSRLYTVSQAGDIAVPLIGSVRARGRTTDQLEHTIRDRLARDFVRDPEVTVDVAQNRPFFILGEVRLPGQYPYVSGMTVETAVAIAGGYTPRASERRFRITRRLNNGLVDQIEAPSDYTLLPGDTVYVFERFL